MMMGMLKRSPVWILLGLSLVLAVRGEQQTTLEPTIQEEMITAKKVSLLGGWNPRSPESEEVQAAALHAVEKFNGQSKSKKTFQLVSITSAQSQVTNVINYKLKAILGKTACLKSETNQVDKCTLGHKRLACTFEVSFNPRKQVHQQVESSCHKMVSPSLPTASPPLSLPLDNASPN
ncbi:unnamed protein product [Arctogadus glacialis]|uniref:cystatin n=1 Tax=Gadus chalcogrammus TaxID=1042646 RepID=UPI0024C4ABCB|nr:cystatin [Gadus chalcogrammus]XP_059894974.1 cystatin [Gadus macrocephalus]